MAIRTDLAIEVLENSGQTTQNAVQTEKNLEGFRLTQVEIHREDERIGKPPGSYYTLSVDALLRREEDAFPRACRAVAHSLGQLTRQLDPRTPVLVIGLGNRAVTPDAIGPLCCQSVLATRHLVERSPAQFRAFRPVAVLAPGVLGTTGVETGEIVMGVMDRIRPGLVIAVDALAARRLSRLMCTIQMTDTGIVPGSGVGNARAALTRQELGVPVLAVGVPTVVDGATLAADIAEQSGASCEALDDLHTPVLVTTRDVDQQVADAARVIGYGINLFLHPTLDITDIDLFLS
ncbi:GPR endopeptidase [Butyricicoccus porcorum]|uniref:GPR endopeptidase n=1 Tax=Butyricicoccus porcorum TaxID=1945634 RepID=UPI00235379C4|nr:GPR endopeptidase [Butyricicoccus porcorum]